MFTRYFRFTALPFIFGYRGTRAVSNKTLCAWCRIISRSYLCRYYHSMIKRDGAGSSRARLTYVNNVSLIHRNVAPTCCYSCIVCARGAFKMLIYVSQRSIRVK